MTEDSTFPEYRHEEYFVDAPVAEAADVVVVVVVVVAVVVVCASQQHYFS